MHRYKSPFHIVGTAAALAGIAILGSSGFKDLIIAAANRILSLGLDLNRTTATGWSLLGIGVICLIYGEARVCRSASKPCFIAFHHHSLDGQDTQLQAENVPIADSGIEIEHIDCDQSLFFARGACDPIGAVRDCLCKVSELGIARKLHPDAQLGYYGLAHVGLQFVAGCEVASQSNVLLFEQNRNNGVWTALKPRGPCLDLTVVTVEQPPEPRAIVIRVAISYELPRHEVAVVVPQPFEDVRIGLNTPRIDAIAAYNQVNEIAEKFRGVLDDVHARRAAGTPIHVFYAGPACLGFSLGRRISKTIHHPVWVHQYDGTHTPRYRWAVHVTGNGQPETLVAVKRATGA